MGEFQTARLRRFRQKSTGFAAAGRVWRGADKPIPLPVLDHASGLFGRHRSHDWGSAHRALSPVKVAGAPMSWMRPASRLGSAPPAWEP
jgi:hypothetical protein